MFLTISYCHVVAPDSESALASTCIVSDSDIYAPPVIQLSPFCVVSFWYYGPSVWFRCPFQRIWFWYYRSICRFVYPHRRVSFWYRSHSFWFRYPYHSILFCDYFLSFRFRCPYHSIQFCYCSSCLWYLVPITFSVPRYLFPYYRPTLWVSCNIWFWSNCPSFSFLCPYHGIWFWHYWPRFSFCRRYCRTLIWHYCLSSDSVFTRNPILILFPKIVIVLSLPHSPVLILLPPASDPAVSTAASDFMIIAPTCDYWYYPKL